mgnify:CR=1 FL=1
MYHFSQSSQSDPDTRILISPSSANSADFISPLCAHMLFRMPTWVAMIEPSAYRSSVTWRTYVFRWRWLWRPPSIWYRISTPICCSLKILNRNGATIYPCQIPFEISKSSVAPLRVLLSVWKLVMVLISFLVHPNFLDPPQCALADNFKGLPQVCKYYM